MFQIISFKEDGLANLALIKLCEDDSVRLLRSLNPDAEDGVQGEEFGEEWTLADRGAAAAAFLNNGFWRTWTDINGTACGGINLYDQLCEEGVRQFMEMNDHPFVVCNDEYDAANAVLSLSPGLYLFYVPVLYDIPSESDAEDADTCSKEEIIESEAFKTVYEHAIAGGMSKDDAYTEAYVAALQEISPYSTRSVSDARIRATDCRGRTAKEILEDLDMADDSLDRLKTANPYIAHEKLDDRYRMTATDASASRCRPWRRCEMYAKSSTADAPSILS